MGQGRTAHRGGDKTALRAHTNSSIMERKHGKTLKKIAKLSEKKVKKKRKSKMKALDREIISNMMLNSAISKRKHE